jgi:AraC family transcriptional activator FtrA
VTDHLPREGSAPPIGPPKGPAGEQPHRVVVLVPGTFSLLGVGAVVEVFTRSPRECASGPWYQVLVCSAQPSAAPADTGVFSAGTVHGLRPVDEADTIVVPEWTTGCGGPTEVAGQAIRRAHARGARIVAWGTGTVLLAEAGLLDGRRVAVHWTYADRFARHYPSVRTDASVLFVDDGDVLTAAGAGASIDVCLHLLRQDHGAAAAGEVAERLVAGAQRDGSQRQRLRTSVDEARTDLITEAMTYVLEHLDGELAVEDLARRTYLSSRQFSRRFRDVTGTSPTRWVTMQRLQRAQLLLETTDHTIGHVASAVGFASPVTFRQCFVRELRTSPSGYRRAHRDRLDRSGRASAGIASRAIA